jgi:uncharacterized membrane protein YccF (DUF307 family)
LALLLCHPSRWQPNKDYIRKKRKTIGDILWFILGGLELGLLRWFIGCIFYITIIGIPWGKAAFVMGEFAFFPF